MPQLDYAQTDGKGLSYSRRGTLHSCARKFELENILNLATRTDSVTFSYGHLVGSGIQEYLRGESLARNLVIGATQWAMPDFWDTGTTKEIRAKKSFWTGLQAIQQFQKEMQDPTSAMAKNLKGYELANFTNDQGKVVDGVELTFLVELYEGYIYEGHIDVILYHPAKNEYLILEIKTTAFTSVDESQYQNSDQALSYSIVLDKIAGNLNANSSYKVMYLIYSTTKKEFIVYLFPKSVMQRAGWLNGLQYDVAIIEMYKESGQPFPTNGASCFNFFRPCNYIDTCTYTNAALIGNRVTDDTVFAEMEATDFTFTLDELIQRQQELMSQTINISDVTTSRAEIDIDDLFAND